MESAMIVSLVIGFIAGLGRGAHRMVPVVAAVLIVTAFLGVVIASGIWAAQCWDCADYEYSRSWVFKLAVLLYGFVAAVGLGGIWVGAWLQREIVDAGRRAH
jgi:hypothetical protein